MPWEDNSFFNNNEATMQFHVGRYEKAASGNYQTEKAIHDEEREQHKETLKAWNRKVPQLPESIYGYETGTKYATTHRCFGEECKEPKKYTQYSDRPKIPGQSLTQHNDNTSESDLIELNQKQGKMARFRYQNFEAERDASAGYPQKLNFDEDTHKFVQSHIETETGRHLNEGEVMMRLAAIEEAKLQKAAETPAFKLKPGMINDWPGDRFTTTHRCFGERCKGDLLMQQSAPGAAPAGEVKAFRIGDL